MERQRREDSFGLPATTAVYPAGRLTERQETADAFRSSFSSSYRRWLVRSSFEAGLLYDFSYGQRQLGRQNGFGFAGNEPFRIASADSIGTMNAFRSRQLHELRANARFNYRDVLNLNANNRGYLSSTLRRGTLFLPGAGVSFTFSNLYPFSDQSVLTSGNIQSSYARTVQEAPLLYTNWHYASTGLPLAGYQGYYELPELPFAPGLEAERHRKFEAGAEMEFFGRLTLEFNYFRQLTKGALFPVATASGFGLVNGADIANRGMDGSLRYRHYAYNSGLNWDIMLSWSRFNPMVERLYNGGDRIPLAGFVEVSTNLAAGRPVGMLYGSTYLRNGKGERLIGPDGFPLVNPQMQPIGNPNPDWTAGLSNSLTCSFVVDVRKGGDIWNGTGQVLDYYGVSRRTGEERLVRNYLFNGVKSDGSPNDVPIHFTDPGSGLEANRWVRYGMAGVAEEAVTDGSWVRLQEVKLTYNCSRLLRSFLPAGDVRLSFIGKNLLLLSRYPGVDPSSALFGYNWGAGLDFFNAPGTRSYGVSLDVQL
jgi:hypothetical protein